MKEVSSSKDSIVRPDGDVDLERMEYTHFQYPSCPQCTHGILKPKVVYFGENMHPVIRDQSLHAVDQADLMWVIGSSLEVYSAFRLVRKAVEQGKPVVMLNLGKTRADQFGDRVEKFNLGCSDILPRIVERIKQGH
jgi:NAD-dependent SIR2 family protein deacetylase